MSIGLIGDIAFNGLISEQKDTKRRFSAPGKALQEFDLVFANLEVPIFAGERGNQSEKIILTADKDVTAEALRLLNIGCVSLANNHIFDAGFSGLKQTVYLLEKIGIKYTGAGWKKEHIDPVVINHKGLKIGFLAFVDKSTSPHAEGIEGLFINYFEPTKVVKQISELRKEVDKIIISIHWGRDYSHYFSKDQQSIAYQLLDEGADVIMGHHPHTIQSYESVKDKLIFYSLGQLCFGDFVHDGKLIALKKKTKTGMIVELDNNLDFQKIIATKEKKGNYVEISKRDLNKSLRKYFKLNMLSFKNSLVTKYLKVKEAFFDRLFEYFFGYYRNPVKQLFSVKNYKKIKYAIRDYRA